MFRNPEVLDQQQYVDANENKQKTIEVVSAERLLEIAKKYGVSAELITLMLNEQTPFEKKYQAYDKILKILANAVLHTLVDPKDIEDVSAIVGPEWGASKEEYLKSWNTKHAYLV